MTDKRILIELPDAMLSQHIIEMFDKGNTAILYTKDFLRITEIDLDDGTVRNIPRENRKIIFTKRKGYSDIFDYEIVKEEEEEKRIGQE